jgi:hypothetical protein
MFWIDKVEDFGLKYLWQRLRALYGVGEAVIEVEAVLKSGHRARGVPVTLASQSLNYQCRLES